MVPPMFADIRGYLYDLTKKKDQDAAKDHMQEVGLTSTPIFLDEDCTQREGDYTPAQNDEND